jgi:hypothetical protein
MLLHAEQSSQVQNTVLDIFEVPRPASALVDFVEHIGLTSVEDSLCKVGFRRDSVE